MRILLSLPAIALLASCAEMPAPADDSALQQRQEAACVAAIAAHIRQPVEVLSSRWIGSRDGIAVVETVDGTRLHRCEVDADARVLGYTHPGR